MHFINHLIGRIRTLTNNVRSLALMDAYGRVARLLLETPSREGRAVRPEKLTQAEIASRVGCSREMVSRIFKDLVQGRYITIEPDRIVINRKAAGTVVRGRRSLLAATAGASLLSAWPLHPRAQTPAKKRVAIVAGYPNDRDPAQEKAQKAEVASSFSPARASAKA
jgi:DNA-binding Lrp family transcriptional regulator